MVYLEDVFAEWDAEWTYFESREFEVANRELLRWSLEEIYIEDG